ncbi:MAG: serine hydrolase [Bacteroidales bacterium]|nr:serine hydrolase [Bacteroidales bacterium]
MLLQFTQKCKTLFFQVLIIFILVTSCFPLRVIYYQTANIDDYKIFKNDTLISNENKEYPLSKHYNKIILPDTFENYLLSLKTTAFIVVKNDSLYIEKYYNGYNANTISNSFSIAKSIISILIALAIKEQYIKSYEDYVTDYLPELENFKDIKIINLLTMSTGIIGKESYYNPFGITAKAYYGNNLKKIISKIKVDQNKKNLFEYNSLNTQILGMIIERSTGVSLSEYATQKLWNSLQMEYKALWSLDKKDGQIKAYCCLHATARDFAKIGSLMLNKGKWRNVSLPDWYIKEVNKPATHLKDKYNKPVTYYSLHWWLLNYNNLKIILACGLYGQYIGIVPHKNIVFVRLGHKNSEKKQYPFYEEIYKIAEFIKTL